VSKKKDLRVLQAALPAGTVLTHTFRAEPRLRKQLPLLLFTGLILALLYRGARAYIVGLTDDTLFILSLPRWKNAPGVTTIRATDLLRLEVKRGALRTKITIDTASAHYRLRVPGLVARGETAVALSALAQLGAQAAAIAQQNALVAPTQVGLAAGTPTAVAVADSGAVAAVGLATPSSYHGPSLVIVAGENTGMGFPLYEGVSAIGRHPANAIVLSDPLVSARHARIERTPTGRCFVADDNSANGTMLNGQPLREPTELKPSDVLQFGSTVLRFVTGS
jgi:hypothetical protein